jgi:F0F1-type ATP synthase membrane subunit b/b'
MSILPDPTQMALNMVPFLVAILGMYFIILKPLIAYLEEREAAITGGRLEAEEIEVRIGEKMSAYEAELSRAKTEVAALRNDHRAEAQEAYSGVIAEARAEAEAEIAEAVTQIQATRSAAGETLKQGSTLLAQQVATQVLGRQVAAR